MYVDARTHKRASDIKTLKKFKHFHDSYNPSGSLSTLLTLEQAKCTYFDLHRKEMPLWTFIWYFSVFIAIIQTLILEHFIPNVIL
jgi:hypothetical protein